MRLLPKPDLRLLRGAGRRAPPVSTSFLCSLCCVFHSATRQGRCRSPNVKAKFIGPLPCPAHSGETKGEGPYAEPWERTLGKQSVPVPFPPWSPLQQATAQASPTGFQRSWPRELLPASISLTAWSLWYSDNKMLKDTQAEELMPMPQDGGAGDRAQAASYQEPRAKLWWSPQCPVPSG